MNTKLMHRMWVLTTIGLAMGPRAAGAAGEEGGKRQRGPQIVATILKVDFEVEHSEPSNLVMTAVGQVPTGGYTKPRLVRATYATPPDDGIADYFLLAVPPAGFATQVISEVKATDRWKGYTKAAPWLQGIRVHGTGDGVVVKMLPK
jgi:hypothetical protein